MKKTHFCILINRLKTLFIRLKDVFIDETLFLSLKSALFALKQLDKNQKNLNTICKKEKAYKYIFVNNIIEVYRF